MDAIRRVQAIVQSSTARYCLGIFVDIQGAFDNIWWPQVWRVLQERRCPPSFYRLLRDYFRDREISIYGEWETVSHKVQRGCPQGSVLGPRFWNLIMDSNIRQVNSIRRCHTVAFADDQVIVVEGDSRVELERRGQEAVNALQRWAASNKLAISTSKTMTMLLKGRLDVERPPRIFVAGQRLTLVPQLKYLGVLVTERLAFQEHLSAIAESAGKIVVGITRVSGNNWGMKPRNLRMLYRGLFEPLLSYAAPLLDGTFFSVKIRERLNRIQRQVLLKVSKAYRTVSTDALPVLMGVLPADLLVKKAALNYKLRTRQPIQLGAEVVYTAEDYARPDFDSREVKTMILGQLLMEWQYRWETSEKGRTTFRFMPDVSDRYWDRRIVPNHITAQFLTGHGNFRAKLHYFGLSEERLCPCGEEEDVWHVLLNCEFYQGERDLYLGELGHVWPPDPPTFLRDGLYIPFCRYVEAIYHRLRDRDQQLR